MIYADSSVILAALLVEDRKPAPEFWQASIVSSRLAMYEVLVRLHALHAPSGTLDDARELLRGLSFAEMVPAALGRALSPFPLPVRSLDALHLATAVYLKEEDPALTLATYDRRMAQAAQALGLALAKL